MILVSMIYMNNSVISDMSFHRNRPNDFTADLNTLYTTLHLYTQLLLMKKKQKKTFSLTRIYSKNVQDEFDLS